MKLDKYVPLGALAAAALLGSTAHANLQHPGTTSLDRAIDAALSESSRDFIRQVGTPFAGVDSAWQAANRERDLRTYLLPEGARVLPRSDEHDGWRWGLTLERFGRAGSTRRAGDAQLRVAGERAEYARGSLVEWYVNHERGLEHGIDVQTPPAGSGPLELQFALEGELRARIGTGARDVVFTGADGRAAVSYADLRAFDSTGRALPAHFEARGDALAVLVEDAGAAYPITVDPLINNLQAVLVPTGAHPGGRFGTSLSIDGNRAVVGAAPSGHVGQAYALEKIGSSWQVDTKFTIGAGGAKGDRFGAAVCVLENNIVIGAPGRDVQGNDSGGVTYYRQNTEGEWFLIEFLTSATTAANDQFGASVDMGIDSIGANTYLIVGAPGRTVDGDLFAGAAYTFVLSSEWIPTKFMTAPNGGIADFYGSSVSIDGDTAAVGAPFADGSHSNMGEVHVWRRSQLTFVEDQLITSPTPSTSGGLGTALSVSGNRILMGAPGEASAHVFVDAGSNWFLDETFLGENGGVVDFGNAVALDVVGNVHTALIGAPVSEAAYIFAGSNGTWSQTAKLELPDGASVDDFGSAVALQGTAALVGAPGRNVNAAAAGAAFSFERVGSNWVPMQTVIGTNWDADENLGFSVDVEGDTAIVGAVGDSDALFRNGAAYVFERAGTDWSMQAKLTAGGQAKRTAQFGQSVGISGDDVVVGASREDLADFHEGAAYVFSRSGSEWSLGERLVAPDRASEDVFGTSVAIDGERLVIGAPGDDDFGSNTGSAYAYERSGGAWVFAQKLIGFDSALAAEFGTGVDLDGDILIVGSPNQTVNNVQSGSAYLFERSGTEWVDGFRLSPGAGVDGDDFGASVSIQGDRAAIGAPFEDTAAANAGAVHVFERDGALWTATDLLTADDAAPSDHFGTSVALEGALLAVGSMDDSNSVVSGGAVYVYHSTPDAWVELGKLEDETLASNSDLGRSVALSGTTLVTGAPGADEIGANSGKAYVVLVPALEPVVYCTAKSNSCGSLPSISSLGESSASASSGFELRAAGAKAGKFGVLLYSDNGRAAAPFQGGLLCIEPSGLRRTISVQDTSGTPGQCNGVLSIDMNAFATGALGGNPIPQLSLPGTGINAQFWARDIPGRSLLSDALEYVIGN